MKYLSILGSTGSIGTQVLEVVRQNPKEFKIVGLTANNNAELLLKQIKEFRPKAVSIMDNPKKEKLLKSSSQVYTGIEGLNKIASLDI
jgi:1-deoxy-D-xylulose-5-phosphate reductoisomerase